MSGEENVRIGTVDLNRVFGSLHSFRELKKQMDHAHEEAKQETKKRDEALRDASPAEKYARMTEFQEWRKSQALELQKLAVEGRAKIVAEIKRAVRKKAEKTGLALVVDTGEVSTVGTPVVLF